MYSQKYYREKYLKYKIKYLELKNNFNMDMIGGDLPYITRIDKINLFKPTIQSHKAMEPYLNPIYGLIMHKSGYIKNKFFLSKAQKNTKPDIVPSEPSEPSEPSVESSEPSAESSEPSVESSEPSKKSKPSKTSKLNEYDKYYRLLKEIPGQIQPNNEIMTIDPKKIGGYIALLYICKTNNDLLILTKEKTLAFNNRRKYLSKENIKQFLDKDTQDDYNYDTEKKKLDELITVHTKTLNYYLNKVASIKQYIPIVNTTDINEFHIILFCLWWVLNNDKGIEDYYTGINEVFRICNQYLPKDKQYDLIVLDESDSNPNSFEQIIFKITKEDFKIYKQEQAKHFCPNILNGTYPDCGEVTARNLINLICYNSQTKKFDIEILKNYGGIGKLINYYTVFNNFTDQSSIKPVKIYDEELNPRDAWSKLIISDEKAKHNLRLGHLCRSLTQSFDSYNYELKSGMSLNIANTNFFQLICNLLPKVTKWDDLLTHTKIIEIKDNIDSDGIGTIVIHHNELKELVINCKKGHYYMEYTKKEDDEEEVDYTGFTEDKHDKISQLLKKKEIINKDNYFWIDWSSELLVETINVDTTEIELKKKLLELSFTDQYDSDTRRRIAIDVDNTDFFNYFINNYGLNPKINEYTYISNNFEFVKQLKDLRHLNCYIKDKSIRFIDLSPLIKLTSIGDDFLARCEMLKIIDLSPLSNITSIGYDFLAECKQLDYIDLKPLTKIKSIGNNFLARCEMLKNIDLRPLNNIESIENNFLSECKMLKNIDLRPLTKIKSIGHYFLYSCENLKSIVFDPLTEIESIGISFLSECKMLKNINLEPFRKLKSIKYEFLYSCENLESIVFDPLINIESIDDLFLANCKMLKNIDLTPLTKIKSIGHYFLHNCENLESIVFHPLINIELIGDYFLHNCVMLNNIDFRPLINIKYIGDCFLYNCKMLNNIDLTPLINIESIGDRFLAECKMLNNIDLTPLTKIESIGDYFLANCEMLNNIDFRPLINIKSIGDSFLYSCYNLESIVFNPLTKIESIGDEFLAECNMLNNINLEPFSKLKSIGDRFLYSCEKLESIDLTPLKEIKSIGYKFLKNCKKLKYIYINIEKSYIISSSNDHLKSKFIHK
jgi:hypothetical protein